MFSLQKFLLAFGELKIQMLHGSKCTDECNLGTVEIYRAGQKYLDKT